MISKIVRRYSKALYEETIQLGINKDVINDVTRLLMLIDENKMLRNFFGSPLINKLKKKKVIKILFENKISKKTLEFLLLLVSHSREDLIKPILEDYIRYDKEMQGIIDANITSVVELDDKSKKEIEKSVADYSKKIVIPKYSLDNELIGGFIINLGDYVIDASINRQLEIIKNKFKQVSL